MVKTFLKSLLVLLPILVVAGSLPAGKQRAFYAIKTAPAAPPDYTDNIVAWYKFDTGSGTTATDSSGNAKHGTLDDSASSTFPAWSAPGKVGDYCLLFTDYSAVTFSTQLASDCNTLNSFTINLWFKLVTAVDSVLFSSEFNTDGNNFAAMVIADSAANISVGRFRSGYTTKSASCPATGGWHMLTYVNTSGAVVGYLDGVAMSGSGSIAGYNAGGLAFMGRDDNSATLGFEGYIDDVRIYSEALDATKVLQLFNAQP